MKFSIIIPLYNEAGRLPKTAGTIFDFFKAQLDEIEIIFVNDGSTDNTLEVLKSYQNLHQFQIVSYAQNRGKGYAVKQGALAATGDWIIFFDIDLATPLEVFNLMLLQLESGAGVIIGSRRTIGAKIEKCESKLRIFLGQGFTCLSNILVPGISDFTCGFKCYSKNAAHRIFSVARIDRWGFDTELLYIAKLKKIKIIEIPVKWTHDSDSKVKVFRAVFDSFRELCAMKLNQLKGYYDGEPKNND